MNDINDAPVIQFCFCPPMADLDDPEQHRAGCHHAEVLYRHARWGGREAPAVWELLWTTRRPEPSSIPSGCYAASFGTVHVRPGCRCPR